MTLINTGLLKKNQSLKISGIFPGGIFW